MTAPLGAMVEPPEVPALEDTITGPFGRAAEEPYHRRGSDVLRVVSGAAIVLASAPGLVWAPPDGRAWFEVLGIGSSGVSTLLARLTHLAVLWALVVVAGAALVARRVRLTRDLLVAGALAWFAARVLGLVADGGVSSVGWRSVLGDRSSGELRLCAAAAIVAAAAPYVGRPVRRIGQVCVATSALAAIALTHSTPRAALEMTVLGWTVAAVVHLVFGSPAGRPTSAQLAVILRWLGLPARAIELAPRQPPDATVFLAVARGQSLRVEVIGRDEVEAQLLARGWRSLRYRDAPSPFLTRLHRVEHEACMTLLAREAGVRAPRIRYAGRALVGSVIIVGDQVEGPTLGELDATELTDARLDDVWEQVRRLHESRIVHGNLHGDHVVFGEDGATLVDFSTASTGSFHERSPGDVAELLAGTASIVGVERAVAACARVLTAPEIIAALPMLQKAAMSATTLGALPSTRRRTSAQLAELRGQVARVLDVEEPQIAQLRRVKASSVVLAGGTLFAVGALLDQLSGPARIGDLVSHAHERWLLVASLAALATTVPFTVAFVASVTRRISFLASFELQVATCYANLALPGVGGVAAQVRFLQKEGVDSGAAVAAGGVLSGFGSVAAQLGLCALSLWLSPNSFTLPDVDRDTLRFVFGCAGAVVAVMAVAMIVVPPARRFASGPVAEGVRAVLGIVRSPLRLTLLLGGNAAATVLYAACLLACVRAFDGRLSFWTALAMVSLLGVLGSVVPFPGGATAVGAFGLAGGLTAFGIAQEVAVSAALTNQIITGPLLAIPGLVATRDLTRRDVL